MDARTKLTATTFDCKKRPVSSPGRLESLARDRYTARMIQREFKVLFCDRFRCPPSEFENRAFKELLYWHAEPLASVIRKFNSDFFDEDSAATEIVIPPKE